MLQVSKASGVNDATIVRLERGSIRAPQPETLRALGEVLGLSSYELFMTCEWLTPTELPPLAAYLRTRYEFLSSKDVEELQQHLVEITQEHWRDEHQEDTTD